MAEIIRLPDRPEWGDLGDKEACAAILGCSAETWATYVRRQEPASNPPPRPVYVDMQTNKRFWVLRDVRAFHQRRPSTRGVAWSRRPLAEQQASKEQDHANDPR